MKIVILTAIPFWHPATQELIDQLRLKDIDVVALDIFHGKYINEQNEQINLLPFGLTGILARIYLKLFRRHFTKQNTKQYDIIDIHFIEAEYSKYIPTLGKKYICSIFGSDLFRTTSKQKSKQQILFKNANGIVLSKNMCPYFEESFPGLESKYYFNQYGSNRLDAIDTIIETKNIKELYIKYKIPKGKIVLTCGYNGKQQQQHIKLLNQLTLLPNEVKSKLFLVLPLTYGLNDEYFLHIKKALANTQIESLTLTEYLTDDELIETRIISSITINTQTTDALSSSIKEAFVAKDTVLAGEWLPYDIYTDMGVIYQKISFSNVNEKLMNAINNIDETEEMRNENCKKILAFASWNTLIGKWVNLYKMTYNGSK